MGRLLPAIFVILTLVNGCASHRSVEDLLMPDSLSIGFGIGPHPEKRNNGVAWDVNAVGFQLKWDLK